ncbi:MAG: HEAT repeat domain-containing protein [Ardenticatenaceae bacterium]|nr:HEAT repeat domain-containing protein [Ardenticatenaceae bacterium]
MTEEKEKPFADVLLELFETEPLPISQLYRLSDMQSEEMQLFDAGWTAVSDERRQVIVRHLADISEDNFVVDFSPIFIRGFNDPVADVRMASLDGLWDTSDLKLIAPITELLHNDPDEGVQVAAASALGHFVLMGEWGQLPERILPGLINALLARYDHEKTADPVRRVVLEALGPAGHPRVNKLIEEAYENGDQPMQVSAVFAMGATADRRWSATVMSEMESPYEEMRAEAARAAGAIGNSDFVARLAELAYDEDLAVRLAAIGSLGQIGGDEVQRILAEMLDDPEVEEDDEVMEAVEEAMEEAAMMAGDFDFVDFGFDEEDEEAFDFDD